MEVFTIGFTKKSAKRFFELLKSNGIKRLIDIRLNNNSQLAGYTKKEDLAFFLEKICGAAYIHNPDLAPTQELLKGYQDKKVSWSDYEVKFNSILRERRAIELFDPKSLEEPTVFLCSEATPEQCHRRLVVERLKERLPDLKISHL